MIMHRGWARHLIAAIVVALLAHALTVWAIPRLIMDRVIAIASGDARTQGGSLVFLPPSIDHTQRRIVMPSPDLLYATCAFDLRDGPLRVRFAAGYPRYWSIALYASTSDTFYVINDRTAGPAGVDLRVSRADDPAAQAGNPAEVRAPTDRGLLLLRLLVNDDPKVRAAAAQARRTLRCTRG
jgi:uncharacterized membrane protein